MFHGRVVLRRPQDTDTERARTSPNMGTPISFHYMEQLLESHDSRPSLSLSASVQGRDGPTPAGAEDSNEGGTAGQ